MGLPTERDDDVVSEPDFTDLEEKYRVKLVESYEHMVVVDGLPIVDKTKKELLLRVLPKIFSQVAPIKDGAIIMPEGPDPKDPSKTLTKGFAFIQFENADQANACVKQLDGHRMDRQHVFMVNKFTDVEKYVNLKDTYEAPKKEEFKEREHLKSWLMDPSARDQFVMLHHTQVSIFWNNKSQAPEHVYSRENWTDTEVQWSPKGSYLATFHRQGIALWGGSSWNKISRFAHPGVRFIDFSPNEEYLVTYAEDAPESKEDPSQIIIWNLRTGKKLRGFNAGPKPVVWPAIKWSPDEKYFARLGENVIGIFDVATMTLLDKQPLKVDGVKDFSWSPKDNVIAYWTPEIGNSPARVTLVDVPSKQIRATKNLFNVSECKLLWQSEGNYLCVKVDRHTKTKKSTFINFEFFRLREKNVPVENLELKDNVFSFSWEPSGSKLAVSHTDGVKMFVSFYDMEEATGAKPNIVGKVRLIKTLERKSQTRLSWNPKGQFIVLIGHGTHGDMEFWNVNDMELMASVEHYMLTDVEWDPTGRYVVSSVSMWQAQFEFGYCIWDFKGKLLYKVNVDKFKQLLWRPRPPSPLSKEKMKEIRKNLKDYSKTFDEQDEQQTTRVSEQELIRRRRLVDEWKQWRRAGEAEYAQGKQEYQRLIEAAYEFSGISRRAGAGLESEYEVVEEWVEEVIEETEEVISK